MNGASVFRSLLLGCILLSHSFCFGDENKLSGTLMQAWENIATPNEHHQVLDFLVGRWNYKATSWMTPTAAPQAFKGVTDHRWILGNRVLLQEHRGEAGEHPFEGLGLTTYDTLKKEYPSVWVDNTKTGMMISTAQYDPATKTFSEKGTFTDTITGQKDKTFRGFCKIINDDYYTYDFYVLGLDGKEFKFVELHYTRIKE
jgi:hypothetical protein